ncbi:MAG: hypothetical protein M0D54_03700 [Hyphomonadaceae bacterium JAD_PAG50586_4]|nr:MAG: hypothetical protein M0D54_03700 [Hyphomonadaceae bacterium JAD_PAG50586_4]
MQTPKNLDEAKAIFRVERTKVTTSISAIAGSRWLLAILATIVIAFGTHLIYAPARLPPVGGVSVAAVGLPPNVDFGFAGEQAKAAQDAAIREGAAEHAQNLIAANAERAPLINAIGFGVALVLLIINMAIMTKRRRVTRG